MPDLEILKILPASVLPAALVLVFMFRELNKKEAVAVELSRDFVKHTEGKDKEHRDQVNLLIDRFQAAQVVFMSQQKAVIDDYILVTKETVIAVKGLESSVRELKNYVASQRRGTWDQVGHRRNVVEEE